MTLRKLGVLALFASLFVGVGPAAWAQGEVLVESVDIVNNQFLQRETLLYYVSTKAGDRYDERRIRDDFRRLWETGFLDDLSVESRNGTRGKIVIFRVGERKRIQIVDYRGSKALTSTTIEEELKKRDVALRIDTFYDVAKARRVEEVIKEMLDEKGRPFGSAKHDAKTIGGAGMQVSFVIDDGPKARVKEVVFDGNEVFSDAKLRGQMKKVKPSGFWNLSWLGGKTTYTQDKWRGAEDDPRGDVGRLEDFYLNHGYVQARLGEPRISYTDGKSGFISKKPVKWMKLDIPVTEGPQYRVGEVKFEGLTVFKEEFIRTFFKQEPGDVYNEGKLKKGFDKVRDLYGSVGYFQWTGGPRKKPDPVKKVVDVTLFMEEDKRYYVGRINFTGNDSTRDKVIRREVYMNEGDVFNTEALKASIRRVNQLGYFKPIGSAPELRPDPADPEKIDVTLKVEEQNRNQLTLGGGFSGLEGGFLNASFSTSNFLGKGETLHLTAQSGQRTRNFELAVTEPYFLDRPITAGGAVFDRRLVYPTRENAVGYTREDRGFSLRTGVPTGRSARAFLSYGFQAVDISDVDEGFLVESGLPAIEGVGRRYESRLMPTWVRNTVDDPYRPRSGSRLTGTFELVGGPLQGTVNYWSPSVEAVTYRPVGKRMALGLRGELAYAKPFAATTTLPYYRRYLLGGESQVRGFDPGTISPTDPTTGTAIGGNKFGLLNAEYYFDVAGPLRLLLFFDAGEAAAEGQALTGKGLRTSTGVEARFTLPVLNVPLRFIWAVNPNRAPGEPKTSFRFAIGSTF